jgi:hypothetical protein
MPLQSMLAAWMSRALSACVLQHDVRLKRVRTKAPPRPQLKRRRPENSEDEEDFADLDTVLDEEEKPEDAGKDANDDESNFTWVAFMRQGATPRGAAQPSEAGGDEEQDEKVGGGCPSFSLPLTFQVYRLIALSQQEGVDSMALRQQLGFGSKTLAKFIRDIVAQHPITISKKAVGRTSVQVYRLSEFASPTFQPSGMSLLFVARVSGLSQPLLRPQRRNSPG